MAREVEGAAAARHVHHAGGVGEELLDHPPTWSCWLGGVELNIWDLIVIRG